VLGIVLTVVGVALLAIPGIGEAIGLPMIAAGISSAAVIGIALEIAGSFLMGGASMPKIALSNASTIGRLQATFVTMTPRKIGFGITALANDVRYQAYTGSGQSFLAMIIVHASHAVQSIDELWLDNELAWTLAGGAQGRFVGYLTVTPRTVGTSANGIAIDGTWTSTCTLTGCAYSYVQFKLTGATSSTQSPFASGVTSRMTWRGKGAKVYDPRLDSTVAGGSGSQRANDQTTWTWDANASRNPALQELWYELGWKIGTKLAVGKGVPPARIDLASYAVAANHCDESITLNGGGTEPRYRSDAVISEGDDPSTVRDSLCLTMNAVLRDAGGKLALNVIVNDLATPLAPSGKAAFDEDDVLADMQWEQTPDLSSTFNIVRGQRTDPSDAALYQQVDFPEVALTSNDGIDRIDTIQLPFVQSNGQAQRIAKQRLQRAQYQGKLTFAGKPSFWGISLGNVFALSHSAFGWSGKLFRCTGQTISRTGQTQITAVEENAAIYAWANNEAAAVVPGTPVVYDPLNSPLLTVIGAPGDSNRIRFSKMEQGTLGWVVLRNSSGGSPSLNWGTDAARGFITLTGSFTANSQEVSIATNTAQGFEIPVTAGERIYVSSLVRVDLLNSGGTWNLTILYRDGTGATIGGSTQTVASGSGTLTPETLKDNFLTVPASAATAVIEMIVASASSGAGSFDFRLYLPMLCGAGAAQTTKPAWTPGPDTEAGAQVTRWIANPTQSLLFKYDYLLAAQSGEFPRDLIFNLMSSGGAFSSGVTWTYTVLTGTVNGFTNASGVKSMSGSGAGTLTVSSLGSSAAKVQVNAAYLGQSYTLIITLAQSVGAAPVTTPSGGSGSTGTIASKTGSLSSFSSTTFTDVTGAMTATPAATAVSVNVNLDCNPTSGINGAWTVECKVMRDIGGVPTQIGSTQSEASDWSSFSGPDPASFAFTIADTGLTSGTSYTWRVYARITSGSRSHYVTGSVTVTA
jgi:hypothetical protein